MTSPELAELVEHFDGAVPRGTVDTVLDHVAEFSHAWDFRGGVKERFDTARVSYGADLDAQGGDDGPRGRWGGRGDVKGVGRLGERPAAADGRGVAQGALDARAAGQRDHDQVEERAERPAELLAAIGRLAAQGEVGGEEEEGPQRQAGTGGQQERHVDADDGPGQGQHGRQGQAEQREQQIGKAHRTAATRIENGVHKTPLSAVATLPRRQTRVVTWPLVTVFGFIAQPDLHFFLKPLVTRTAARNYGHPLRYASRPSWDVYAGVLELARAVRRDLRDMRPRDMIDLQSFLWVQGSDEYDE